jgi:hypothetical protein
VQLNLTPIQDLQKVATASQQQQQQQQQGAKVPSAPIKE